MKEQEFLNQYQLLYRKLGQHIQWIVINKSTGDIAKKYRFQIGVTSQNEFELFTGKDLNKEIDAWFIDQLIYDFKIKS
ncbi:MAG: hypothetical protein IM606_15740 [Cytophagales bacterium]|jgi:hypothetical protein|nr:hypothetical protein [Cytophagales bacterium]MCA6392562.1 hypothetical protein [Cytophagales bacterium]MCA6396635.1 hypothetical protein [Cytophagales bacterium]MCA6401666.1 hypothetical protein [Cytophagales bacterium]MCA6410236.1 hypothetical protein [Cytophagales bacterium]